MMLYEFLEESEPWPIDNEIDAYFDDGLVWDANAHKYVFADSYVTDDELEVQRLVQQYAVVD